MTVEVSLLELVPPLQARIRKRRLEALAGRLAALGAGPLLPRLQRLTRELEAELETCTRDFTALARRYQEAPDEPARRRVLADHLRATVKEPKRLQGDLRALRRGMGLDVLRERTERTRHRLLVDVELLLHALGPATATEPPSADLVTFLLAQMTAEGRSQNRLAAATSLVTLLRSLREGRTGEPEAEGLRARLQELALTDEDVWIQGRAHAALLVLDARLGRSLLEERLVRRTREAEPEDWLLRGQLVRLTAKELTPEAQQELLLALVRAEDPSVHVRLTLCQVLGEGAGTDGPALLEALAGLVEARPEPSPQVRASALIAAARRWQPRLASLFQRALERERHPLPLRIACEELTRLGEAFAGTHRLGETGPALLEALERLRTSGDSTPAIQEHAAAAQETLEHALSPERHASTEALRGLVARVPPGGVLSVPAQVLSALPREPLEVGRLLAQLSRQDFGLSLQRSGDRWTLWRGDHFRRRLWRILYELRHLAPNKRQAFHHTIGRVQHGELRAHPGQLHEVTATWVPGERVHIEHEGGWSRHLPTVDDLLDLPLVTPRPVRLFSSHGITTLLPPAGLKQRLSNRLRLSLAYPELAALRLASLGGDEPHERRRYLERVAREHGITVRFQPYRRGVPGQLELLFSGDPPAADEGPVARSSPPPLLALPFVEGLRDWFSDYGHHFLSQEGSNGPLSLGIFSAATLGYFLAESYRQRGAITPAREAIPLCIGGWGTRGKSGTERLKAALFGGLGFEVFAKTTGSEAMFLHTVPNRPPVECFIYRPYDKASIWEQRDMLRLGAALHTEVFLWECMALNPTYVSLLQHDWMRDDLATMTNAYPDHEDIQGPAGQDVAQVITRFIPTGTVAFTSEDNFLPLFKQEARARGTELHHVADRDAELLPDELLARFPYKEHPRNVALVARLAEHLGVERDFAIARMGEHVVPEIGVLKVFPTIRARGRRVSFINGHSANERTGFLNNWRRTGLDAVDPEAHPDRAVFTVVNNRWDRISRSQVFARILVEDAAADRHLLIGTNLEGLLRYITQALDGRVATLEVTTAEELATGERERAQERLAAHFAWLKIPRPTADNALARLECFAAGAGLVPREGARERLGERLSGWLNPAPDAPVDLAAVRKEWRESGLGEVLSRELEPGRGDDDADLPEVLEPATREEVLTHAEDALVRLAVHARLRARLKSLGPEAAGLDDFHARMRASYRELFLERVTRVDDSNASGDKIVELCVRLAPPGQRVSLLGAQNIKGTGLDWVYRWLAVDAASRALVQLASPRESVRQRGLDALEAAEDHGLLDTGLVRVALARRQGLSPEERTVVEGLRRRYEEAHAERLAALTAGGSAGRWDRVLDRVEQVLEVVDSVRRRQWADQVVRDLVDERITHARASIELRALTDRQKGGWLAAWVHKNPSPSGRGTG